MEEIGFTQDYLNNVMYVCGSLCHRGSKYCFENMCFKETHFWTLWFGCTIEFLFSILKSFGDGGCLGMKTAITLPKTLYLFN